MARAPFPPHGTWQVLHEGQGQLKSWTLCDGLSEGIMARTGCAGAPRPPAHPWCRGVTEGLCVQGQVSAPSALPWPRRGLPERPMGAGAAPNLYEPPPPPPSLSPPFPLGEGVGHT